MNTPKPNPEIHFREDDIHWFNEGTHRRLYEKLGAHVNRAGDRSSTRFATWAPNARSVSVVGDFNGWDPTSLVLDPLNEDGASGLWQGATDTSLGGELYKYHIVSRHEDYSVDKADPFAFHSETPPKTASIVWELDYEWQDSSWMKNRKENNRPEAPISIYELHLGSWRRDEQGSWLSYREMAPRVAEYVSSMGFTHVELLPVMEHPFAGSWGYQTTGYFAPTSRYGRPQDFMYFVDVLHQHGIGVLLDWVPSHFPMDEHGLAFFDGTYLFEHADPRQGFHPDWKSAIFNYARGPVCSFLVSSALFWLDRYHIDGLRVDAVASMLYLDYSREEGEWIPNQHGGRENLDAIHLLRQLNDAVHSEHPDALTIAEESTSWPRVSRPSSDGGLGFDMKWDMGWMHDTLGYFSEEAIHRKHHHDRLTFRMLYAFAENFVLALSHDEVVHGKASLLAKMPGDDWERFANLRLLYCYMFTMPGKKLLFMGDELAQRREWNHDAALEWDLLDFAPHQGMQRLVRDLNRLYRLETALHDDFDPAGFEWIDCADKDKSIVSFVRRDAHAGRMLLAAFNFTPVARAKYRIGAPLEGTWTVKLNSDQKNYDGSEEKALSAVSAEPIPFHGHSFSFELDLPPLGALLLESPS